VISHDVRSETDMKRLVNLACMTGVTSSLNISGRQVSWAKTPRIGLQDVGEVHNNSTTRKLVDFQKKRRSKTVCFCNVRIAGVEKNLWTSEEIKISRHG